MKLKSLLKRRSIEQKIYDRKYFNKIIEESKFVDLFDGSFAFEYETENVCINFYKDENGKNIIEQFLIKSNDNCKDLILMDSQEEIMFVYKDKNGKNIIEEFLIKSNYNWKDLILMDFQE